MNFRKYGKLELFIGPMFSGKTTSLLKNVLWNKHIGRKVCVFKPTKDVRYSLDEVVSHDGLSVMAHNVGIEFPEIDGEGNLIVLDEVQFFDVDVVDWVYSLLQNNNDVIAVGLDMDTNGFVFDNTAILSAMADEIHKLKAVCSICGAPASKTFKKVKNDERILLGSSDIYESRCNNHWSEV